MPMRNEVVRLLKEAFQQQYGEVEDDAVLKITGTADDPLGFYSPLQKRAHCRVSP